tara:strand:- start:36968 stop:37444 length:477 start_codon:yes stop_codon:yes gene_type:complete
VKNCYLFPFRYKKIGWILVLIGLGFGVVYMLNEFEGLNWTINLFALLNDDLIGDGTNFSWVKNNVFNELTATLVIIVGLLVAFSKSKFEDEYISGIRMESLIWITYVNYGVLLFTILFVFGMSFFDVMIYNMFTILIFFVLRFHFILYKAKRHLSHEE